jgi:hypothetical protein
VLSLAGGHAWRALTEGSYTHFVISGIARFERKSREPRLTNSRVASCDKHLWNWALVIALWLHGEVELAPSAVRIGKLPKRTCGSIIGDSSRESKESIWLEGDKE